MRTLLIALLLLLPGCVTSAAPLHPAAAPAPVPAAGTPAPSLAPGTAFTYAVSGGRPLPAQVTLVVARANATGYLLAASRPEELEPAAIFDAPWMGELTRALSPAGAKDVPLQFPLRDNLTWAYGRGNVTARAATLDTPLGPQPGFVVEGAWHDHKVRFEYAPALGFFVRYHTEEDGAVEYDLRLERIGQAAGAWWLAPGARADAGGMAPGGSPLAVQAGERVFVAGRVDAGGRASLTPPLASGGSGWTDDGSAGRDAWALLDGAAGSWLLAAAPAPPGMAYAVAQAARIERV